MTETKAHDGKIWLSNIYWNISLSNNHKLSTLNGGFGMAKIVGTAFQTRLFWGFDSCTDFPRNDPSKDSILFHTHQMV